MWLYENFMVKSHIELAKQTKFLLAVIHGSFKLHYIEIQIALKPSKIIEKIELNFYDYFRTSFLTAYLSENIKDKNGIF